MIHVVGGIYFERCWEDDWDQLFGSGLRAAAAITSLGGVVQLEGYAAEEHKPAVLASASAFGVAVLRARMRNGTGDHLPRRRTGRARGRCEGGDGVSLQQHSWDKTIEIRGKVIVCCSRCGAILNRDGSNERKHCKGPVRVGPRKETQ